MFQDSKVGIHPPLHTVLGTGLFRLIQATGGDASCYAFLPANVGEVVHGCLNDH
jgi:hypothetical protein